MSLWEPGWLRSLMSREIFGSLDSGGAWQVTVASLWMSAVTSVRVRVRVRVV
ncbi:MAG: hypothetical protein ACK5KU_05070 [Beutenbergiaceae bacterium]